MRWLILMVWRVRFRRCHRWHQTDRHRSDRSRSCLRSCRTCQRGLGFLLALTFVFSLLFGFSMCLSACLLFRGCLLLNSCCVGCLLPCGCFVFRFLLCSVRLRFSGCRCVCDCLILLAASVAAFSAFFAAVACSSSSFFAASRAALSAASVSDALAVAAGEELVVAGGVALLGVVAGCAGPMSRASGSAVVLEAAVMTAPIAIAKMRVNRATGVPTTTVNMVFRRSQEGT